MLVFGLIEIGQGEGVKISLSNLINYYSVSRDSKRKKIPQKSGSLTTTGGGAPPKTTTFFEVAPKLAFYLILQDC